MRERPILFSGEMVRAILAGRKTVTRRVVKPQPEPSSVGGWRWTGPAACGWSRSPHPAMLEHCPYGAPGDRLWMRETFSPFRGSSEECRISEGDYVLLVDGTLIFRDGHSLPGLKSYAPGAFDYIKWRPSIHMPRWASRLSLEVTGVRVERLKDITEEGAKAEGFEGDGALTAVGYLRHLWDRLNGERGACWLVNPWVWVVEFKVAEARS